MKFLELLNKPVSFRKRPLTGKAPDTGSAATGSASGDKVLPASAEPATRTAAQIAASTAGQTSPHAGLPTTAAQTIRNQAATPDTQTALLSQQLDETALLFATGQPAAAIALLDNALSTLQPQLQPTETERRGWQMLLELYASQRERAGFDRTALAYAQRFEASPPQWRPESAEPTMNTRDTAPAAPLFLSLRERLDASAKTMFEQWQQRSAAASALTLDLGAVSTVDLAGCHLLLAMLAGWQQRAVRVQLQRCDALLAKLRTLIQSGRRDEDDAGWLLLIEMLRLAGDVERYEDACLAYSLTYEMSPPAAPPLSVTERVKPLTHSPPSTRDPAWLRAATGAAFVLPEVITMPVEPVLVALRAHVRERAHDRHALVLDARRLQRIDFHAATALQASLTELAAGKPVEWQGVSFLVSTLLRLTCGSTMPGIINRQP